MRIIGIDPGEKNIGVAISDPTGTLARPLMILQHVSRQDDAHNLVRLAGEENAGKIVIGMATDLDGKPNLSGRKARRLAAEIRTKTTIPVELWDESFSTQIARKAKLQVGTRRKFRQGHLDDIAAVIILQSYLDYQNKSQFNATNTT